MKKFFIILFSALFLSLEPNLYSMELEDKAPRAASQPQQEGDEAHCAAVQRSQMEWMEWDGHAETFLEAFLSADKSVFSSEENLLFIRTSLGQFRLNQTFKIGTTQPIGWEPHREDELTKRYFCSSAVSVAKKVPLRKSQINDQITKIYKSLEKQRKQRQEATAAEMEATQRRKAEELRQELEEEKERQSRAEEEHRVNAEHQKEVERQAKEERKAAETERQRVRIEQKKEAARARETQEQDIIRYEQMWLSDISPEIPDGLRTIKDNVENQLIRLNRLIQEKQNLDENIRKKMDQNSVLRSKIDQIDSIIQSLEHQLVQAENPTQAEQAVQKSSQEVPQDQDRARQIALKKFQKDLKLKDIALNEKELSEYITRLQGLFREAGRPETSLSTLQEEYKHLENALFNLNGLISRITRDGESNKQIRDEYKARITDALAHTMCYDPHAFTSIMSKIEQPINVLSAKIDEEEKASQTELTPKYQNLFDRLRQLQEDIKYKSENLFSSLIQEKNACQEELARCNHSFELPLPTNVRVWDMGMNHENLLIRQGHGSWSKIPSQRAQSGPCPTVTCKLLSYEEKELVLRLRELQSLRRQSKDSIVGVVTSVKGLELQVTKEFDDAPWFIESNSINAKKILQPAPESREIYIKQVYKGESYILTIKLERQFSESSAPHSPFIKYQFRGISRENVCDLECSRTRTYGGGIHDIYHLFSDLVEKFVFDLGKHIEDNNELQAFTSAAGSDERAFLLDQSSMKAVVFLGSITEVKTGLSTPGFFIFIYTEKGNYEKTCTHRFFHACTPSLMRLYPKGY